MTPRAARAAHLFAVPTCTLLRPLSIYRGQIACRYNLWSELGPTNPGARGLVTLTRKLAAALRPVRLPASSDGSDSVTQQAAARLGSASGPALPGSLGQSSESEAAPGPESLSDCPTAYGRSDTVPPSPSRVTVAESTGRRVPKLHGPESR